MYNIIPLIIIFIGLGVILAIILKKIPLLATFDVNEIPEEKAAATKKKIINERLQRKAKFIVSKVEPFYKILANFFQRKVQTIYEKIKDLEEKYRKKPAKEPLVTKEEFDDFEKKLENLLKQAKDYIEKEQYPEAERKYIEILNLDPKNIEAYRGLGNLYLLQKNYEDAKQTFSHILKINKADDAAYAKLGSIALEEGDLSGAKSSFLKSIDLQKSAIHFFELAEVCYKMEDYETALDNLDKALALEANNPKYLDLFITVCIIIKDKVKASEALERLKEVNADNKKIEDFVSEIKNI